MKGCAKPTIMYEPLPYHLPLVLSTFVGFNIQFSTMLYIFQCYCITSYFIRVSFITYALPISNDLLVLNVGLLDGLLGVALMIMKLVIMEHSLKFPAFSTSIQWWRNDLRFQAAVGAFEAIDRHRQALEPENDTAEPEAAWRAAAKNRRKWPLDVDL